MIMAHDPRPASPRRPMRRDQHRRVELEMARRIGRDIGGGQDRPDPVCLAQQQAANLMRVRRRFGHDLFQQPS